MKPHLNAAVVTAGFSGKMWKILKQTFAMITNQDQTHLWQNPQIITQEEIYDAMCAQNPDVFDFSMFCQSELSPRSGYIKTCSLLEKISSDEKIGIVVTDAILTHGVISAILQKQYLPIRF